jgi:hypothetical protein
MCSSTPSSGLYFEFQLGDAYLHFNGVCFGWKHACYVFTIVMQEVFLEVRARSIFVSSYIDDGLAADTLYARCLWAIVLIVQLLNHLGAYFGLPKCRFRPTQPGEWLGFEVVSQKELFRVLDRKMEKVCAALTAFLDSETTTSWQLAAVAGKLISLSPAVLPASLHSRTPFQAMQGKLSWDDIFLAPEMVTSTIKEWLEKLLDCNGRR